ncbi:MAG TPA: hydrogen peroxide-inducible genes activator [Pseudomonadales bacterium]
MTLTELRYLVTLARTGHFGKAAEACHVSQPTLSIALKKLEDELGVALIERSKNRIVPTAVGEQIIRQADKVLGQVQVIHELADAGKDSLASPLRLGAIFTIGPYLFPHLIPELSAMAPAMPLVLEENYTAVLRRKLVATELDAILIALPFNEADVVTRPLYEEPFVVLMPKDHPWAAREAIAPEELANESVLLLGEGHCFRDQILAAIPALKARMQQADYPIAATANTSLDTLKHMVSSGLGITVLPLSAAGLDAHSHHRLCTRPFTGNGPKRTVALAWRASFPRFNAIDILCNAVNKCRVSFTANADRAA